MNGVMNGKEQDNINIAYNASNSVNAENSLPDSQPLPPPIDASVEVIITPDCLEAYLYVNPPANGGALPSLQMYQDALKAAKVTYGIIANKLEYLVAHPLYNERILIAKGYPPVAGKDGTYELKFRAVKDLRPKVREDGSVDFRDLGIVENVKKNQLLCVITPPTDGEEGMTVTGKKLLPIKGSPVPSLLGKNVEIGPDGVSIYSQIDGQVDFINEKIYVNETFVIQENVDNSTGNVKVAGNLVIKGMVMPGFRVEAEGNIEIKGTVESATVIAGGNIVLRSGMMTSEIICQGNLDSKFIENSSVFVKGQITSEYILNSSIRCGKSLQIIGRIAKFVGGSCIAGEDVVARVIGSSSHVATSIELGTDPSIIERQREILKEIPVLEKQIQSTSSLISLLKQREAARILTNEQKLILENAEFSNQANIQKLESMKKEMQDITELIQTKGYGRIICKDMIYPGTTIKIGSVYKIITEPCANASFYYDKGEINQGTAV